MKTCFNIDRLGSDHKTFIHKVLTWKISGLNNLVLVVSSSSFFFQENEEKDGERHDVSMFH